jgi:hypothetical protein
MQSQLTYQEHLSQIDKAAESIRLAKKNGASRNQLLEEIFQLLYHKHFYCLYSPVPVTSPQYFVPTIPFRVLKIRFRIQDPEKPKQTLRFQMLWKNRITLAGSEVIEAVKALCANKLSYVHTKGEFFKVQLK